jgi:hypothetical protein
VTPSQPAKAETAKVKGQKRDRWHTLRDAIQRITLDPGLPDCGRLPVPSAGGQVTVRYERGRARWVRLRTCRKGNLCPVCGNRIRTARGDQLARAAKAWADPEWEMPAELAELVRAATGGGLAMGTYTLRHFERQPLEELVQLQRAAWRRAFGAGSGSAWRRLRARFGIVGDVRAFEVTHGANGWHPHFHTLYFLRAPLTEAQRAELEQALWERWSKAVVEAGGYTLSRKHGFKLDTPKGGDIEAFARYIAKEITGDQTKTGRGGRRTPWQIAQDWADTGSARDRGLWRSYELGIKGVWYLRWSDKLAPFGRLFEDRTDDELAAAAELDDQDEDQEPDEDAPTMEAGEVLGVSYAAWFTVVLQRQGRRLEVVHALERSGLAAARALLESWGLTWGSDCWSPLDGSVPEGYGPPDPPADPGPEQLVIAC